MDGIKQEINEIETVTRNLNTMIRKNTHKGTFTKPDIIQIAWAIDLLRHYQGFLTWEDPDEKEKIGKSYTTDAAGNIDWEEVKK